MDNIIVYILGFDIFTSEQWLWRLGWRAEQNLLILHFIIF